MRAGKEYEEGWMAGNDIKYDIIRFGELRSNSEMEMVSIRLGTVEIFDNLQLE